MSRNPHALFMAAALMAALAVAPVGAGAPARAQATATDANAPQPHVAVGQTYEAVQRIALEAADQATLTERLMATLDVLIDYDAFAARALKGTWGDLNSKDRGRFKALFRELVVQTYAKRFKPKTRFAVRWRGPGTPATAWVGGGRDKGRVETSVEQDRVTVDVTYAVHLVTGEGATASSYKVYDLEIDEVSMALNWRRSFKKVVSKDGFEALLDKLHKKVEANRGR